MRHLRASIRLVGVALIVGTSLALRAGLQLITIRAPDRRRRFRARLAGLAARAGCRVFGMRINVEGHPPRAPFWLVSNHVGYVDVVLLMGLVEGVFVAKQEVRTWPFLGVLTRAFGTLYLDRSRPRRAARMNALMQDVLDRGEGLVFFPEGTSTAGDRVLPFRSLLLEPAAATSAPVHYAAIEYQTPANSPPASESVCWWGEMTFPGHFYRLLGLPHFHATVRFGARPLMESDRKRLARQLRAQILEQLELSPDLTEAST